MFVILYNRTVVKARFPGYNFNDLLFLALLDLKMEFQKMN
jgi:hypothetical protein